jgi:glycosyltransferase involved in cell wall biosynthesis
MKIMQIGVVGDSILSQEVTGVGMYASSVVERLNAPSNTNVITVIDYKDRGLYKSRVQLVPNPFPFYKTYLWHNYLPTKLSANSFDYLFNFTGVPHMLPYRMRELFFVYDISWYLYPKYHPLSRVLFYRAFFPQTIRNAHAIVVDSMHAKDELIRYFNVPDNKIYVIYPVFRPNVVKEQTMPISRPYILSVGTLEPRKNIPSLLKAFSQLKHQYQIPHSLVVAGKKGWKYKEIFDLVESLRIEKFVHFTGYISDEQKNYLLKNASCLAYPSYYEGFGIPVLEAMQAGCPVVTSDTSSIPEVVGDAAELIDPLSVSSLAEGLYRVISNQRRQQEMKHRGIRQAKTFTYGGSKDTMGSLINHLRS